jgi:Mn-containing catalase
MMYTVRVDEPNPNFAKMLLEQFGGPNGELAAAMRYFTQGWNESDVKRRDMLLDIATEELSHLEMVGQMLVLLLKGSPGAMADEVEGGYLGDMLDGEHDKYIELSLNSGENVLGGGGPRLTDSSGHPWTAAYIDTLGNPTADLRSDIAAEARAKIVYERLIKQCGDAGARDTLTFLMQREVAHQKMFEAALEAIPNNFPPGRISMDEFAHEYFSDSVDGDNGRKPQGFQLVQSQGIWDFKLREPQPGGQELPGPDPKPSVESVTGKS